MKTFVVCNSKGGVGKTTVSILIALTFRRWKMTAGILDYDELQQSAYMRARDLGIPVGLHQEAPELQGLQYLIVDTPPQITSERLKAACASAQVEKGGRIVLVMPPSMLDFEATLPALSHLGIANNPAARLLYNKVSRQSHFGRRRNEFGAALPEVRQLSAILAQRSCYQRAMCDGLEALSEDARTELDSVVGQLLD